LLKANIETNTTKPNKWLHIPRFVKSKHWNEHL
jgi:hypothetical protein